MKTSRTPLTVLAMLTAVAIGACSGSDGGSDGQRPTEPEPTAQEPVTLECEEKGFPCTWAEVDPQAERQGRELAERTVEQLSAGDSVQAVAAALFDDSSVVEVGVSDTAIRFRVEGGRPEWVFVRTFDAALGAPAPPPSMTLAMSAVAADPVGDPDQPPAKGALVMSPFRWQWQLAGIEDRTQELATFFEETRDFSEPGAEVVVRTNELSGDDPQTVERGVGIQSFTDWRSFQAIHLLTHGAHVCNWITVESPAVVPGRCVTMLATGGVWPQLGNPFGGAAFATELGVGRFWVPVNDAAVRAAAADLHPGTALSPTGLSVGPFLGLTTDFFVSVYPSGLEETIVFLSACHSAEDPVLVQHLSQGNSTVLGWDDEQGLEPALEAGSCFWRTMLGDNRRPTPNCDRAIRDVLQIEPDALTGGQKIEDVVRVVRSAMGSANASPVVAQSGNVVTGNVAAQGGNVAAQGGNVLSAGDEQTAAAATGAIAAAQFTNTGDQDNRAIEIVRLMEADTRTELTDGGYVSIDGTPGDGEADTLLAELEVFGIGPSDNPEQMTLYLDVDGVRQSQSYSLVSRPTRDRARTVAELPLDVDLVPDGTIDVEVWLEYPDGKSHWRYRDLDYTNMWTANVGLGPYAGGIAGATGPRSSSRTAVCTRSPSDHRSLRLPSS